MSMALLFRKARLVLISVLLVSSFASAQRKYPTHFGSTEPSQPQSQAPQSQTQPPAATATQTPETTAPATNAVPQTARKLDYEFQVSGTQQWTDTGIDLLAGDRATVTSEGTIDYGIQHAA